MIVDKWSGGLVVWKDNDVYNISVAMTWKVDKALKIQDDLLRSGENVRIGGPAITLLYGDRSEINDAVVHHNPTATFTTKGCIRNCGFCAVPVIEGRFREIPDFVPRSNVCDNNFLASSRKHFDLVIDKLKGIDNIDFNQGLDARLLTDYKASRLAELKIKKVRLAWDTVDIENQVMDAYQKLRKVGFTKNKISIYVLIGFNDSPNDALYRLRTVWNLGVKPFAMRYQPLDAKKKNEFVGGNWTQKELLRYSKYWNRLRWYGGIPFEEFDHISYRKEK